MPGTSLLLPQVAETVPEGRTGPDLDGRLTAGRPTWPIGRRQCRVNGKGGSNASLICASSSQIRMNTDGFGQRQPGAPGAAASPGLATLNSQSLEEPHSE